MTFDWDLPDAFAVKAVAAGRATEEQQRRAFRFIVDRLGMLGGLSFATDDRRTAHNEGRRFVAVALQAMAQATDDEIRDRKDRENVAGLTRPKSWEDLIRETTFAGRSSRATKGAE